MIRSFIYGTLLFLITVSSLVYSSRESIVAYAMHSTQQHIAASYEDPEQ